MCKDNLGFVMDDMDLYQKWSLSESVLYKDFMKQQFLLRFEALKSNCEQDLYTRRSVAEDMLQTLRSNYKDQWDTVEEELELCVVLAARPFSNEQWNYLLADRDRRCQLFCVWFKVHPNFKWCLAWFDQHHIWDNMDARHYLFGAGAIVQSAKIIEEVVHDEARRILRDWHECLLVYNMPEVISFLELYFLDIAVLALGIAPSPERKFVEVPQSVSKDLAQKLLKGMGKCTRKMQSSLPARTALQLRLVRGAVVSAPVQRP